MLRKVETGIMHLWNVLLWLAGTITYWKFVYYTENNIFQLHAIRILTRLAFEYRLTLDMKEKIVCPSKTKDAQRDTTRIIPFIDYLCAVKTHVRGLFACCKHFYCPADFNGASFNNVCPLDNAFEKGHYTGQESLSPKLPWNNLYSSHKR